MALPAQNDITNAATVADLQGEFEDQRDYISTLLGAGPRTELTIAAGTVTPGARDHGGIFTVDTEADAASDDLDTITNTNVGEGQLIMLTAETVSRVVTVKHNDGGTGEMMMTDSADFVLDALDKWILFRRDSTQFIEITRGYGVDNASFQAYHEIPLSLSGSKLTEQENLAITRPSVATVTITADRVVLRNASGYAKLFSSVNVTPDITVSGAGGLDTGTEANSTWYHIWLIGQSDGTLSAVFSTSTTTPTLPSGYTFYGYVGALYNNSIGNFREINQLGNVVTEEINTVVSAGSQTSYVNISLATAVPPTATAIFGYIDVSHLSSAFSIASLKNDVADTTAQTRVVNAGGTTSKSGGYWRLLLHTTPQRLAYSVNSSSDRVDIRITGWEY